MEIGVIADTHLKGPDPFLRDVVQRYFAGLDLVLHAGDVCTLDVLRVFEGQAVKVVAGNRDRPEVKARFPEKALIEVGGIRIGLIHGWGPPWGIIQRLEGIFEGVQCVVFGHTHRPLNLVKNGVLYFNPGSFSGGLVAGGKRTIGIIETRDGLQARFATL